MTPLRVLYLSNWVGNPYMDLLAQSLSDQKVQVKEQFRQLFFLPQVLSAPRSKILHLQTLHYIFVSRQPLYFWLKFLVFITQIYALKLWDIRTVWTVHEWKDKNSKGQHDLSPTQAKIVGQALDGVITHCKSTQEEMIQALDLAQHPEKVFVVPHGNYIGHYKDSVTQAEARKSLDIPEGNTAFLLFGGIHANKGVLEAIAAFKQIETAQATLIIAGQPNSQTLRETILNEIANHSNILFVNPNGHIPDDEVQRYMKACDVVVLPYKIFTTSGVALLAMSFKKACIAPAVGFFWDVFEADAAPTKRSDADETVENIVTTKSAFLYDPHHEQGLATALQTALHNKPQLAAMGQQNLILAEAANWGMVAAKTARVYRWTLGESTGEQP